MNSQRNYLNFDEYSDISKNYLRNNERVRIKCYASLVINDILGISIGFFIANYYYLNNAMSSHGVAMISVILPTYLWIAIVNGSYNATTLQDSRVGAFRSIRSLFFAAAMMLIIAYSFKVGAIFSRFIFWFGSLTTTICIVTGRLLLGRTLLKILGGTPFSTIVIVDGIEWKDRSSNIILNAVDVGFDPNTDDPLHYHRLAKFVSNADRVLVVCQDDRLVAWARVLKSMAVDGELLAPEVDRLGTIGVSQYDYHRTLVVSAGPLHLRDRCVKRIFDIMMSSVLLILLAVPLILIAIAIKIESPGSVLFRQQRIGRDNTLFMMLKFRSMFSDRTDHAATVLTTRGDSRVTRVGHFIRRNSLDELPQLFNVLWGNMSIVGPRPHALSAKAAEQLYWEIDDRYRYRHAVKPGVTGLAQIRGFRGATVSISDLTDRLSSDLEYLSNWTMSRDLWIIFRTVFVLRHDNAF